LSTNEDDRMVLHVLRPICEIAHFVKWAVCHVGWALENVPISRIGQML